MSMQIKLGNDLIDLPEEFNFQQWKRMKEAGEDLSPISMISICSGVDKKLIKKAELSQIEEISKMLSLIYFSGKPSTDVVLTFFHNGVEYGMEKDFSKLKYGAWVDLEVYASQEIDKNIPKILSLLYYPIKKWNGKKYVLEEYSDELCEHTAQEFETVPMRIWWGASAFFLLFVGKYIGNTKSSLTTKMTLQTLYQRGMKMLPKFLRKRLPQGFTFGDSKSSQERTSQNGML
jgi:hypothetical protein